MLEKFRKAKIEEIDKLKKCPVPKPYPGQRKNFRKALLDSDNIAVIAEYKRASPSLGIIRQDMEVEDAVKTYSQAGATAVSILTEKTYFDGNIEYIDRAHKCLAGKIPFLRKDFIFDVIQICATAATPASAILLIARIIPSVKELRYMREFAESQGLAAVVEIFNEEDLHKSREAGADIIQLNARDLNTLKVDQNNIFSIINKHPPLKNEIWIAASGINNSSQLRNAKNAGFRAALIGSSLMKDPDPGKALKNLMAGINYVA